MEDFESKLQKKWESELLLLKNTILKETQLNTNMTNKLRDQIYSSMSEITDIFNDYTDALSEQAEVIKDLQHNNDLANKDLEFLKTRCDFLEKQYNRTEERYDRTEDRQSYLQKKYDDLEKEHCTLGEKHNDLEKKHWALEEKYKVLNKKQASLERKHVDLEKHTLSNEKKQKNDFFTMAAIISLLMLFVFFAYFAIFGLATHMDKIETTIEKGKEETEQLPNDD